MTFGFSGSTRLVGRLSVATGLGELLDETRIRLVEAIGRHGSIATAARAVPMSYRAAWDALDLMKDLTAQALVEGSVGGRHGGGNRLTGHGRGLVALYRAVEREGACPVRGQLGDARYRPGAAYRHRGVCGVSGLQRLSGELR